MKKIEYHIESWWDKPYYTTIYNYSNENSNSCSSIVDVPKELKILVIDKVSHKGYSINDCFGDNNVCWKSSNGFSLQVYYNNLIKINREKNFFEFTEGCRVIPPSEEWLNKCISAINEYNKYYKEKECEHEWVITSGFSHSTAQLKCKKCGREITAIDMGKEYCKSCGQEIKK